MMEDRLVSHIDNVEVRNCELQPFAVK